MANPLVSICIPTYKGAEFLGAAIESVLGQSYQNFELYILNDNSPDDTDIVVSKFIDQRIRYVRNTQNLGPEGNWNKCLDLAQGTYFKLLPHDDVLAPGSLEEQVSVLENDKDGEIALVFGSREIIDPSGRVLMTRGLPRTKAGKIHRLKLIRRCVRAGTNLIGEPGNGLFRRDLIEKIGRYDATHPYLVDLDYWFRVLLHGDAYYTASQTSSFRICPGSWSVAIGGDQHNDFKGFVNKFFSDSRFGISKIDRAVGFAKAHVNTLGRAVFYRYIFANK